MSVLKGESGLTMYGKEGENGVIIFTSKDADNEIKIDKNILIIVDGVKMPQDFDINTINTSDIDTISVLKDETAIKQYGKEGRNGVVVIIRKK